VNYAWHVNLTGPKGTSKDRTFQLQLGSDRIFTISYNVDTKQAEALGGAQATATVDWLNRLVKHLVRVDAFVQVLVGVAFTGSPASGTMSVFQPSAGGQVTVTEGRVQVSVQAAGSITAVAGSPTTGEVNITPTFTFTF
jgi:hypothetical protein